GVAIVARRGLGWMRACPAAARVEGARIPVVGARRCVVIVDAGAGNRIAAVVGARVVVVAIGVPQAHGADGNTARRTSRRQREDVAHGVGGSIDHPERIAACVRGEDVSAFWVHSNAAWIEAHGYSGDDGVAG